MEMDNKEEDSNSMVKRRRLVSSIVINSGKNQDMKGQVFSISAPILRSHPTRGEESVEAQVIFHHHHHHHHHHHRRRRRRRRHPRDWDTLPEGVMVEIAERIEVYEDFEVMEKISRRWRWAMKLAKFSGGGRSKLLPWLMLGPRRYKPTARFYSFSKDMFRWFALPEMPNRKRHINSSKGWLLFAVTLDRHLLLYNPLSGAHIQLPDNSSLDFLNVGYKGYPFHVDKFCLSSAPTSNHDPDDDDDDDFGVMLLMRRLKTLALWRSGDSDWTYVNTSHITSCIFSNVTYCKGEFVAISLDGKIVGCNAGSIDTWRRRKKENSLVKADDMVKVRLIADVNPLLKRTLTESPHLVAIDDKLVVLARRWNEVYSSSKRNLYMLIEVDVSNGKATDVNDLRNRSIFLGENNEAFSMEATSRYRFKPNSIYFAHHLKVPDEPKDRMCILNLADGIYEHHHRSESFGPNALLWIEPRL